MKLSNRQPEIDFPLTAKLTDPDAPTRQVKWQWYRSGGLVTDACPVRTPVVAGDATEEIANEIRAAVDHRRHFVENTAIVATDWMKIEGATKATYTPKALYTDDTQDTHAANSDFEKCLRATVTVPGFPLRPSPL